LKKIGYKCKKTTLYKERDEQERQAYLDEIAEFYLPFEGSEKFYGGGIHKYTFVNSA
jgi:hypothetical protein